MDIKGLPIFSIGTWNGDTYVQKDLQDLVDAFSEVGFNPPLKLGHNGKQAILAADGLPAAGWIDKIYIKGEKLLADISNIPQKIYELLKAKAYRQVSPEIYWDYERNNKKYPRVLKALALLGTDIPAVSGLGTIDAILSNYIDAIEQVGTRVYSFDFLNDALEIVSEEENKKADSTTNNPEIMRKDGNMTEQEVKEFTEKIKAEVTKAYAVRQEEKETEFRIELAKKDASIKDIYDVLEGTRKEKIGNEIKAFTVEMKALGIAPAYADRAGVILSALVSSEAKCLSENKEIPIAEYIKETFRKLPVQVDFSEKAKQDKAGSSAKNMLNMKINAYMENNKTVDYGTAASRVCSENPDLAKEYFGV